MYNMIFGVNPLANILLSVLGLSQSDFGRFRDAYIYDGKIAVYTRCGGGNRDDYSEVFESMKKHQNFLYDEDDDFDSTYATFYFSFPDECKSDLEKISNDVTPSEKWSNLLNQLNQKNQ